eukprot:scaffold4833_cov233-Amphora_coffeaeformis.AAC.16
MSGRGRGRGRGRGGAPTSQARLLLQKSAAEAGVDERSAMALARPAHYPDMLWHSSGRNLTEEEEDAFKLAEAQKKPATALQFTKRSTGMTFLVRKQRQLLEYFQSSPQHIQHVPPHMDIARYHDISKNIRNPDRPDLAVREAMGKKLASTDHLPEELLGTAGARKRSRKRRRNADGTLVDLDEFEKKEKRGDNATDGNSDDDSDDEDDLDMAADDLDEEEEEDDNQDYTTNYYESEDDDDGGGEDGEPVF